jgi:hypothetical protein
MGVLLALDKRNICDANLHFFRINISAYAFQPDINRRIRFRGYWHKRFAPRLRDTPTFQETLTTCHAQQEAAGAFYFSRPAAKDISNMRLNIFAVKQRT